MRTTRLVSLTLISGALTAYGSAARAIVPDDLRAPTPIEDAAGAPYDAPLTVAPTVRSAAPGLTGQPAHQIVATAAGAAIPPAALAAYQRATVIIDEADTRCHLDWPLLAAVGRVESDHGRAHGSALSADGVATPAIVGPALDGNGVGLVRDTDAGLYDSDGRFDHAVGPMQIIPSTWSVVGVDADGDGRRDPQDADDAALAAAVYLCSGAEDLATPAGQTAAVLRYNHSESYVATVLGTADAYRTWDLPVDGTPVADDVALPAVPASSEPEATPVDHHDGDHPGQRSGHRGHKSGHKSGHGHHGTNHGTDHGTDQGPATAGQVTSGTSVTPVPHPAPAQHPAPAPDPTPDSAPDPAPDPASKPEEAPAPDPKPALEPTPASEPTPESAGQDAGSQDAGSQDAAAATEPAAEAPTQPAAG